MIYVVLEHRAPEPVQRPRSSQSRAGTAGIVIKLKKQLKKRGAHGIIGLGRRFRIMDNDGSKSLSFSEFKQALAETEIELSEREMRLLFNTFDHDQNGSIDFEEFLRGVRDPMSSRRLELVHLAFQILDTDKSGQVELDEIREKYNASQHPEVIAGKKTQDEVLLEFMSAFEVDGETNGKVTRQEFQNYYHNVSSSIDGDDYFELMIRNAWHITGGSNTSNRTVRQTVDLKQRRSRSHATKIEKTGVLDTRKKRGKSAKKNTSPMMIPPPAPSHNRQTVAWFSSDSAASLISQAPSANRVKSGQDVPSSTAPSPGLACIMKTLKLQLKARGAKGMVGLGRKFRIMDDDGSKSLCLTEFKKAMGEMELNLSDKDMRLLFEYFDKDESGSINFEEFLQGVRDPMVPRRIALVHLAFDLLDTDGSGTVEVDEIRDKFDASKHPDVIRGKSTADEVLEEFLSTFEGGDSKEKDGKVSKDEFEQYYHSLSSSIDDDDYFELMIRNAWHISGGTGQCANSSNRRVLVTHEDGTQTVEEVKDDLGIKKTDSNKIAEQRIKAKKIETTDTRKKPKSKRLKAQAVASAIKRAMR